MENSFLNEFYVLIERFSLVLSCVCNEGRHSKNGCSFRSCFFTGGGFYKHVPSYSFKPHPHHFLYFLLPILVALVDRYIFFGILPFFPPCLPSHYTSYSLKSFPSLFFLLHQISFFQFNHYPLTCCSLLFLLNIPPLLLFSIQL